VSTPIAYIIFNRPDHTRETFAAIRAQRPDKLFIIADGPRPLYPADTELCKEVRGIVGEVDWPCKVSHNFADENLGLKCRVQSGLDWVFSEVDSAIVLEDDCLPHPDFFLFCEALIVRYADDDRIAVITGNNFQDGRKRGDAAYYFSKYNHCWGWASWRRAWQYYQGDLPFWQDWQRSDDWLNKTPDRVERRYWSEIFNRVIQNEINSWAYPWTASVWRHGGLTATPNVNLVTNIGFGPEGTHTFSRQNKELLPTQGLGPLTHPTHVKQNLQADRYVFDHHLGGIEHRLFQRLQRLPRNVIGKVYRLLNNLTKAKSRSGSTLKT
jgi:hypothetical protein